MATTTDRNDCLWFHHEFTPKEALAAPLLRIADGLEWLMHSQPQDYEAELDRIGSTDEAAFANVTAEDLKERWHILYQVRADALAMFGG